MKRKYPVALLLSGIVGGLRSFTLVGVVGFSFLLFGLLGRIVLLIVVGALVYIFYLIVSVIEPVQKISELLKNTSENELDQLIEFARRSKKKEYSFYERVVLASEDPTGTFLLEDDSPERESDPQNRSQPYERQATPAGNLMLFGGILFLVAGIYFAATVIVSYADQCSKNDWILTEAFVTDVTERQEYHSGGRKSHGHYVTVYDIEYQYDVSQESYSGEVVGSSSSRAEGESFTVKYDPDAPENSTEILQPQTDILIVNLVYSIVFAMIGMWLSGLLPYLLRRRKIRFSSKNE